MSRTLAVTAAPPSPLVQLPNTYRAFYGTFATLRPFQLDVIQPILQGQDLILQAATGSGKTEAVLAPCLERVIRSGREEAIIYVVPTRALVHDLRRRLEGRLRDRLGLSLGIRTGDVKRLPAGCADLLLTTPESLDVMLGSANRDIQAFLLKVTMFVIDEAHQLVQGYRGRHLSYLLQRLERRSNQRLQKIALSATLAGPEVIRESLGLQPDAVWLSQAVQRLIQPHLVHLKREPDDLVALVDDLAMRFGARKLLLFANSRSRCDQLFADLHQRSYFRQATYLHYSNLKLQQRQEVERQFQRRSQALCIATSTLELGIDVGDVDSVILYEPPESVTTFLQRLGRANRQRSTTTFWGICRGLRAGEQLLQFLALYALSERGEIEQVRPAGLPSVLVQQILSNLYERKRISLSALQSLYPQQAERLAELLPVLQTRYWLRQLERNGHATGWRGGWRYAQALKAHQIWSNFPDTEEPYTLEVEEQAIADLPTSIVRQLEVGDQVDLAGRCIRILDIQTGARKLVRAISVREPDGKTLYWIGSGAPVSWEVAQAMRSLLQPDEEPDDTLLKGLFARTRTLLQQQRQKAGRRVVLQNGIELSRTPVGFYCYATYLGTVGNVILQRIIESYYSRRLAGFSCTADAIAVVCSDRIELQLLPLPLERDALQRWVGQHMPVLQALFALNAFSRALPRELLIEEVTDLLWDERVLHAFECYRRETSEIAEGDPQVLEWEGAEREAAEPQRPADLWWNGPEPALLDTIKARLGLETDAAPMLPDVPVTHRTPRALTGTMVGNYMQHQQCDRRLSFDLLPYDQQPAKRALVDTELGAFRAEAGKTFEEEVLERIEQQGVRLYRVPEQDDTGHPLSLQQRQDLSVAALAGWVERAAVETDAAQTAERQLLGLLAQPVLILDTVAGSDMPLNQVGIPDLVEVWIQHSIVWLTVADIKNSAAPRYSQKWQVAFYAALLHSWLVSVVVSTMPIQVAEHGVLLTRPDTPDEAPVRHEFELSAYLAAVPILHQHLTDLLTWPIVEAPWQLQPHCTSCAYIETCQGQAFATDNVMLIPHLTPGEHLKLRTAGLDTLSQAADWADDEDEADKADEETVVNVPVSTSQAVRLRARIRALTENRLERLTDTTPLYPANISTVLFVHLLRDPRTGRTRAWGLHPFADDAASEAPQSWIAVTEDEAPACRDAFWGQLRDCWQAAITNRSGPHLVMFGGESWQLLQEDLRAAPELAVFDLDGQDEHKPYTDLRQLLSRHFALPIPLRYTLASVAQVLALRPEPRSCVPALQDDTGALQDLLLEPRLSESHYDQLQQYLSLHLELECQVWQVSCQHLQSDWQQSQWEMTPQDLMPTLEQECVVFLERQQQWRERDVLSIQQLSLPERVERYRAVGPLEFERTALDAEGRFLAHFRLPPEGLVARFRPGDFLRLNPIGSPNLQNGAGVILAQYEPHIGQLAVLSRRGQLQLNSRLRYVLDEDIEDWTTPRVLHAVREGLAPGKHSHLAALLQGRLAVPHEARGLAWAQRWVQQLGLNTRQRDALLLPFRYRLGLIEGPPGTGKTHLLAWTIIALVAEAAEAGRPLRLVVSALTHQAIDNVLLKVQQLLQSEVGARVPGRCVKWGRRLALTADAADEPGLTVVEHADEVLSEPYLILGATGFGLYQLFDSRSGQFPAFFDWVVFDEASQVVLPQALLSLLYGKGQYLFCGDVQQLPPVVLGPVSDPAETERETLPDQSILAHLLERYDAAIRVRLNETYRLNRELCQLPSRLWYDGDFHPATANADTRLALSMIDPGDAVDEMLDPQRPATLVLAAHTTDHQQSETEVEIIVALAARLLLDCGIAASQLAIIAPHRAQNNAIRQALSHRLSERQPPEALTLPVIDTVERLQGAERDVVLVSLTTSDPDHLDSLFLNNANRFNVAITRARHKLIVVGSTAFFTRIPQTAAGLLAHQGFTAYYHMCQEANALFDFPIEATARG